MATRLNRGDKFTDKYTDDRKVGKMQLKTKTQKILIVDNNQQMLDCLSEMVDVLGREAIQATDGLSALEKLEEDDYKLVVADTKLPEMSGFELLRYVRKYHPGVLVALISTTDTANTQRLIVRDAPDFYLPKPFTLADVEELLGKLK